MNRYENEGLSWISIRSLINEAKINSIYSKRNSDSSVESSSPSPRHESSITMEWKPNTYINQSVCFSSMHDNYCKELQETTHSVVHESPEKDIEAMKCYIHRRENKYRKLQKIYNKDINLLRDEITVLNGKVHQADLENSRLASLMEMMKKEHIQQIQNLQARHEIKLQKTRVDMEGLIQEMRENSSGKLSEKLQLSHLREIEKIRDFYEEKIENMRVEHELELSEKEAEINESSSKGINHDSCKVSTEMIEKKYTKEINNLKRIIMIQKEENKNLKLNENFDDLNAEIIRLREENESLRETIEEYQKTIDELSKELSASFRKKKSCSAEDGIEGDLHKILGQINNYLDSSDLASSKDLGETLRSLQSKIELIKSGKISL